jgi:hypothetical protein
MQDRSHRPQPLEPAFIQEPHSFGPDIRGRFADLIQNGNIVKGAMPNKRHLGVISTEVHLPPAVFVLHASKKKLYPPWVSLQ